MRTGKEFVDEIDILLEQYGEKRRSLCEAVGITPQSISNWKTMNILPGADVVYKIATYFKVSTEWLIEGKVTTTGSSNSTPRQIASRIINFLESIAHIKEFQDDSKLYEPIEGIISKQTLLNWYNNRCIPEAGKIVEIALALGQTTEFLITGQNNSKDAHTQEEYYAAKKYGKDLILIDCLDREDQKIVFNLILSLYKKNCKLNAVHMSRIHTK